MTKPLETCLIPEIIDDATGKHLYPCMIEGCKYTTTNVVGYTNHVKLKHKIQPLDYFLTHIVPVTDQTVPQVRGVCITCGAKTDFRSINAGYYKHCSFGCSVNDPEVAEKRTAKTKAALLEKYGVENASQIDGNSAKVKATKLARHGSENYCNIQKAKKTNLERYGHESYLGTSERIAKQKEHSLKTYGVDHHTKSTVWKDQIKQVFFERYGVDHPASQPEVRARLKTRIESEGADFILRRPSTRKAQALAMRERVVARVENDLGGTFGEHVTAVDLLAGRFLCGVCREEFVMPNYGTSRSQPRTYPRCLACFPIKDNRDSIIQQELVAWIASPCDSGGCGIPVDQIILNDRVALGTGKEIDVYIPTKKTGFELNGNFWHTEVYGSKSKHYHQDKVFAAASKNVRLVHVFEDEWTRKRNLVKEKIRQILGVGAETKTKYFARKTNTYNIQLHENGITVDLHDFFDANHIQGSVRNLRKDMSCALTATNLDGQIIAAMLFTKQKRIHMTKKSADIDQTNGDAECWELVRYAVRSGCLCVGMAGKLLSRFISHATASSGAVRIISYADLAWSKHPSIVSSGSESMYQKIGFVQVAITQPSYCYVHRSDFLTRQHRYKYRKSELVRLNMMLSTDQSMTTEWDVMQKHGFDRIWDCGKIKYELRTRQSDKQSSPPSSYQTNN